MSELLRDTSVLLKLRARHARAELARCCHVAGTDPVADTSPSDRLYQLYVALLAAGAMVLMWLAALAYAAEAGAALGVAACSQIAGLLWVVPAAAFAVLLVHHLRSCPVRMTHPDILWLSPILAPASWATAELACALPPSLAFGALAGFGIGTFLQAAISPVVASALLSASIAAAALLSLAIGLARHLIAGWLPRINVRSLVRANALYADMQPLRAWAAHAPSAYEEARRRRLMASRKPFLDLPDLAGRRLIAARAALSLARQREGIPKLAAWGAGAIPSGALVAASSPTFWIALAWLAAASSLIPASREMTRVFSDDARVRLVSDAIALPRLELLLLDSLPATACVALVSTLAIAAAVATGLPSVSAPSALLVCLSLTSTLLFAGGIDPATHGNAATSPPYEFLVFGHLALVALLSLVGPGLSAAASCAYAAVLEFVCHRALRMR